MDGTKQTCKLHSRIAESIEILPSKANPSHKINLEFHARCHGSQLWPHLSRNRIPLRSFHLEHPFHITLQLAQSHIVIVSARELGQRQRTCVLAESVAVATDVR